MKRKLTIALALGLVLVTLLASCSSASVLTLGDVLNEGATYTEVGGVFSGAEEITELGGANLVGRNTGIAHFIAKTTPDALTGVTFDRHIVYNVNTGSTLFTATESEQTDVSVSLRSFGDTAFFIVNTTRWNLNSEKQRTNVIDEKTSLYDATGVAVATVAFKTDATTALDVVYFDGKCYRAEEETGRLSYAFDYSVLSAFPRSIDAKVGDCYYDIVYEGDKGVKIYDDKFNFVEEFEIPAYAELGSVVFLEGKLLVQYTWELEEDEDKYDFIAEHGVEIQGTIGSQYEGSEGAVSYEDDISLSLTENAKYNIATVIYDREKGEAKEIDCEYLIARTLIGLEDKERYPELSTENALAILYAYKIVDGRVSAKPYAGVNLTFNEKGEFSEVEGINGEAILGVWMVEANRWNARTENYCYLIDGEGTVLGEITNASQNNEFFYASNRIYDKSLTLLYNASENGMTINAVLDGSFLLKNFEGELFYYTGEGRPNVVIPKSALETSTYYVISSDLFVVVDAYRPDDINCEFYNVEGQRIFTMDYNANVGMGTSSVIEGENAVLLPYLNSMGATVYYRFH